MKTPKPLVLVALAGLPALPARAELLNWANYTSSTWSATGTSSNNFDVNNDGSADIRVTIQSTGITFAPNPNDGTTTPRVGTNPYYENGTSYGLETLTRSMGNSTNNVKITLTFLNNYASGVYVNTTIFDVDAAGSGDATGGYIDRISNISGNNGTVAVNVSNVGAGAANTITGSGLSTEVNGKIANGNISNTSGDVFLSTSQKVTSLSFTWNDPGPNYGYQLIALGNVSFSTTPEVGTAAGALLACGAAGVMALRRRRRVATDGSAMVGGVLVSAAP